MKELIGILKAISEENRLRILLMLKNRPMCVCEINEVLKIALSTISNHLKLLKNAGLIEDEKDGRWIIYKLVRTNMYFKRLIEEIESQLKDDPTIVKDREFLSNITRESCALKLKKYHKK